MYLANMWGTVFLLGWLSLYLTRRLLRRSLRLPRGKWAQGGLLSKK